MMRLVAIPSSIARRVASGRQSTARRRSRAGRLRFIGGLKPNAARPADPAASRLGCASGTDSHNRRKETCMRLGLMLGYWGLGLTAEDQRALLLEAESAG